ncbi:MAG: alpha-amylase family glycosyl hydrolase [bacterium]
MNNRKIGFFLVWLCIVATSIGVFAQSSNGSIGADSTSFMVQAGFIQLLTRSNERQLRPTKTIVGKVESPAAAVTFIQNEIDTVVISADADGQFALTTSLEEGNNTFKALATDDQGVVHETNTIVINYVVDHSPKPKIMIFGIQDKINFTVEDNDPDGDPLTYWWTSDDAINPEPLNISSQDRTFAISIPQTPGEYFVELVATDPDSNTGVARNYFSVQQGGTVRFSTVNSNPQWVKDAIIYEIFLPAFTSEGTLAAAKERLPVIKSLGANVIWLMPIYENGETINELNAGYNITDFFKVHPQLGTMADFQDFLQEAHRLGIRVILDTTPNHVSGFHRWVKDVELFRDFSNFRPFLEDQIIGDNRGLGQFSTVIGDYVVYVHYSNWTLANLDYSNIETVDYMLNMYKYWVLEQGIDGYRMDVYWGPQNRYGKNAWWRLFREEMKRVHPNIFILGETDGTGVGSENNFADGGGASDAAYDWNFYGEIKNTLNLGSLNSLDERVRNFSPNLNYNHFTGPNSHYLRFLENHDETRIAQLFNFDFRWTEAGAVLLFTIPGVPLIYAGQEVGETSRRGKINWSRTGAESIFEFYQRLIAIRNTFSTFRSPEIKRISSGAARVYAYLRPKLDKNGFGVVNFSSSPETALLTINESDLRLSSDSLLTGVTYFLNDVLNDTAYIVTKSSIGNFQVELSPWEASVLILADSVINFVTAVQELELLQIPAQFELFQNFPNPFNPSTSIRFEVPETTHVTLQIYNVLGQKIKTVIDGEEPAGEYVIQWNGKDELGRETASGLYILMLVAGSFVKSMKMVKLK